MSFFYAKINVNNRVQKILWYNNAWIIHKRGGQNYFSKTDNVSYLHLLRVFKKAKRNILEMFHFNMNFFLILMKKIHF